MSEYPTLMLKVVLEKIAFQTSAAIAALISGDDVLYSAYCYYSHYSTPYWQMVHIYVYLNNIDWSRESGSLSYHIQCVVIHNYRVIRYSYTCIYTFAYGGIEDWVINDVCMSKMIPLSLILDAWTQFSVVGLQNVIVILKIQICLFCNRLWPNNWMCDILPQSRKIVICMHDFNNKNDIVNINQNYHIIITLSLFLTLVADKNIQQLSGININYKLRYCRNDNIYNLTLT